jgi:hypothetical protein
MNQICLKRSMHSNKCQECQFLAYIKLHANYPLFGHRLQVLSSCSAQLPIVLHTMRMSLSIEEKWSIPEFWHFGSGQLTLPTLLRM